MTLLVIPLLLAASAVEPNDQQYALPVDPGLSWAFPASQPAAIADDDGSTFSYTYLEFGGRKQDIDEAGEDLDSYYLKGSLALGMFQIVASYENQDIDFADTTGDLLSLGAGMHFSLTDKLDIEGDISWLFNNVSSDISDLDDDNSGYVIRAGPRWMPLDWDGGGLELNGEIRWVDLENRIASEDEAIGYGIGARLHFLRFASVGLNYTILEDDDELSLGLRLSL